MLAPATDSSLPGANAGSAPSAGANTVSGTAASLMSHTTMPTRRPCLPLAAVYSTGASTEAITPKRSTGAVDGSSAAATSDAIGLTASAASSGVASGGERAHRSRNSSASVSVGWKSTLAREAVSVGTPR